MLHAVIMAGGAGTRFWPASRKALPKQLLDLSGDRTMIQATVDRFAGLADADRLLIVTNERLCDPIREQLPELPPQAVLGEPCKRDTAPCIGLAAALVARSDPDAVMVVSPADHIIEPAEAFRDAVRQAADLVAEDGSRIVTLGIPPTYPAASFGYIERGDAIATQGSAAYQVRRFREKPAREVAEQYLEQGGFYWNSGIFIWRADTILNALKQRERDMFDRVTQIAAAYDSDDFEQVFHNEFGKIQGKSIDFAVMEHHDNVAVIEAPFRWDDLGNWTALARLLGADENGNTSTGLHVDVESNNIVVRTSDSHLVATVGMTNAIIVHTEDATLVANRNDEESIRQVVKLLEEKGWDRFL